MNAQTFIHQARRNSAHSLHVVEILEKLHSAVNHSATLTEGQQLSVLNAICGIKTDLQGNPSKSSAEVALQVATYINTCRE